jgi:hypothetical protein
MTSQQGLRASKGSERRLWLIQSIRTHLLPAFANRGFHAAPRVNRGPVDPEAAVTFPDWGRFIRARNSAVDLIEVQLAQYGGAAFRINMGVAPGSGMMTLTGHWAAQDILVHWLDQFLEVYAIPRWRVWFSMRPRLYRSRTQTDYDELALRVAQLVPELDIALQEDREGPHVRRVVMPHISARQ